MNASPMRTDSTRSKEAQLIAPCGINCRLCAAFMRPHNPCPGCRISDVRKPKTRTGCKIKCCAQRRGTFCGNCDDFPCERLKHLDQRYRTKYGISMIENLRFIHRGGMNGFLRDQRAKWTCPGCGATLCVHRPVCLACGQARRVWIT